MILRFFLPACLLAAFPAESGSEGVDGSVARSLDSALHRARTRLERKADLFKDHSSWENAWVVESSHYQVRTTHSRYLGEQIAAGLEEMLGHFQTLLKTDFVPDRKFQILIFPTIPEYNAFGRDNGAEHSSFYSSFYSAQHPDGPVAAVLDTNVIWLKMRITHAAFHQYLAAVRRSTAPLWIEEGLASYFSLYWSYDYCAKEQARLVDESRLVPFDRLFSTTLESLGLNTHDLLMEMGTLFNYLRWHRLDTCTVLDAEGKVLREPFGDYLRAVVAGADVSKMAVHRLLTEQRDKLERDFMEFRFPEP
ncbi:MAG: hypothetical protein V2A76_15535 [Planctomycetota bacterium]